MADLAQYRHSQNAPLSALLIVFAISMAGWAWIMRATPAFGPILCAAAVIVVVAGSVHSLTVIGQETAVRLQFGPIPFFRRRIPYDDIRSVEASRSTILDGWGIHYVPGRGWTFNIWGFDCVLIRRHNKCPIRIGTDDVDALVAFLQSKVESKSRG